MRTNFLSLVWKQIIRTKRYSSLVSKLSRLSEEKTRVWSANEESKTLGRREILIQILYVFTRVQWKVCFTGEQWKIVCSVVPLKRCQSANQLDSFPRWIHSMKRERRGFSRKLVTIQVGQFKQSFFNQFDVQLVGFGPIVTFNRYCWDQTWWSVGHWASRLRRAQRVNSFSKALKAL